MQLVPLPLAWIGVLSPRTLPLLENVDFQYGAGLIRTHPLSIDPSSTGVALGLYLSFAVFLLGLTRIFAVDHLRRTVEALTIAGVLVALAGIVQKPLYAGRVLGMLAAGGGRQSVRPVRQQEPLRRLDADGAAADDGAALRRPAAGHARREARTALPNPVAVFARGKPADPARRRRRVDGDVAGPHDVALRHLRAGVLARPDWLAGRRGDSQGVRAARRSSCISSSLAATTVAWVGADAVVQRFSQTNWSEFNNRRGAWTDAVGVWSAFRVTGTGLNTYPVAARFYQRHDLDKFFGEAHNDYLQVLAEGGLLVALPVALCLLLFVREVYRRGRADQLSTTSWWLRRGAVTGLIAIALQETRRVQPADAGKRRAVRAALRRGAASAAAAAPAGGRAGSGPGEAEAARRRVERVRRCALIASASAPERYGDHS